MIGTPLTEGHLGKILPIYQRLASDSLLQRCLKGRTQNANESLYFCIWKMCPKESFGSKQRVGMAVALAISEYNMGTTKTIKETHSAADMTTGVRTIKIARERDHRLSATHQRVRRAVKIARLRLEETTKQREGVTYQAGHF